MECVNKDELYYSKELCYFTLTPMIRQCMRSMCCSSMKNIVLNVLCVRKSLAQMLLTLQIDRFCKTEHCSRDKLVRLEGRKKYRGRGVEWLAGMLFQ